ncbi:MAG: hypothetical protein ACI4SJ_01330 [Candidatus Avispirillum sp.]
MGTGIFTIAGVSFAAESPWDISPSENFVPFTREHPCVGLCDPEVSGAGAERTVRIKIVTVRDVRELLCGGETENGKVASNERFCVFKSGDGFTRLYSDRLENGKVYASSRFDPSSSTVYIRALEDSEGYFDKSHNLFAHIGFEEVLLHFGRVMLHSSYVRVGGGALLFAGTSGAGKSTQAALWERYMGAEIFNGDRTVICSEGEGYTAYGSPVAGSSAVFRYGGDQVTALVLPEKSRENEAVRITGAEAVRAVFSQATVNSWSPRDTERALDIICGFTSCIPVYRLRCTPDRRAPEELSRRLKADGPGTGCMSEKD